MLTSNFIKFVGITLSTFVLLILSLEPAFAQNVGVNSTGADADGSAILDVSAAPGNDKGFLIPRLTTAERDLISSPAEGLQIYNLDCHNINYYNGSVWVPLNSIGSSGPDTPGSISGNTSPAPSATGEVYSITAVSGATGYNWTVPSGATITAGQGTVSITVTFGTTSGNICVTANNACGISSANCQAITLSSTCFDGATTIATVTSAGGRVWMDRNLGASQVATGIADTPSYGDMYQWGRCPDGHEKRTSTNIATLATTAVPSLGNSWDGQFITTSGTPPDDWLSTQDATLWQGVNGTNNPCPSGYRLPTKTEWETEYASWATQDKDGAYGSPLKLPCGGYRNPWGGIFNFDFNGQYWSSTASGANTWMMNFGNTLVMQEWTRVNGISVRCIQQ